MGEDAGVPEPRGRRAVQHLCREHGLLHQVVGVGERADGPVTVQVQLTPVGLDSLDSQG